MRIRILKPAVGIMDGVSLSHLVPGLSYEVIDSLGQFLVSNEFAEELSASAPALVIPVDDPRATVLTGGVTVTHPRAEAADKSKRARRRKKR